MKTLKAFNGVVIWRCGVVDTTTAQLHSRKYALRLHGKCQKFAMMRISDHGLTGYESQYLSSVESKNNTKIIMKFDFFFKMVISLLTCFKASFLPKNYLVIVVSFP